MLVELAGGMLLRVCHPRWVLGGSCLCFGLFATCMAAVKGYAPLMVLRLLLGIAEGTGYGVYLYASMWYNPYELSKRVGEFAIRENTS
jgi:MFS family permease